MEEEGWLIVTIVCVTTDYLDPSIRSFTTFEKSLMNKKEKNQTCDETENIEFLSFIDLKETD